MIKGALRNDDAGHKTSAERKPWGEVMIFKALMLQALHNLSDDRPNTSFTTAARSGAFSAFVLKTRFRTPNPCGSIARHWRKRAWCKNCSICLMGFLKDNGYLAMGGQIIDATIVSAPKQHNSRGENETIKDAKTPDADWKNASG